MSKPIITWYAKKLSDQKYSTNQRFYAGNYTDEDQIVVDIQVWNNRWGTEDVDDLENYDICIFFDRLEDEILLTFCTILYNGAEILTLDRTGNKAILEFTDKPTLKGTKNNGSSIDNPANFLQLRFVFSATEERLKDHDLKSLFFEILER